MNEEHELAIAFGPVGLAGWALFVLGIVTKSRLVAALGLGAVVADVTVAVLGGFRADEQSEIGQSRGSADYAVADEKR